jgi:outer membrane protein assembly factor BamB
MKHFLALLLVFAGLSLGMPPSSAQESAERVPAEAVTGWASWRGPDQDGTSREKDLPERVAAGGTWTHSLAGRGTPVIHGGRLYAMGYRGDGGDFEELLVCLDAATGALLWEHVFKEFLSDVIYHRFAIGSPAVDVATGHVMCLSSAGLLSSFTATGELRWQRCLSSEYGRLTFPNGRTGSPLVVQDLTIIHVVTSAWGVDAPARDRFYAFETATGLPVWSATPGGPPKDNSFSLPVVAREGGQLVLYAGLGCGHVVCLDAATGQSYWRVPLGTGGINSSALLHGDRLIVIHGVENLDSSAIGRMVSLRRETAFEPGKEPVSFDQGSLAVWRNDLASFSSSPVLVGDRVYQTVATGELCCVDAVSGKVLWEHKLAPDQIHASPVFGDGKLYVPMNNGAFFIVRPGDRGPEILQEVQLEGNCLGAPAIAGGRVYVHTTDRLYCFAAAPDETSAEGAGALGEDAAALAATRLQPIPGDIVLRQGERVPLRVRSLDRSGRVVSPSVAGATWAGLPAGVTAEDGVLSVAADARPDASAARVNLGGIGGVARIRIVPRIPWSEDFEDVTLAPPRGTDGAPSARPPASWVGAGGKWEVRERDGNKVLAKTLDNPLFQRTMSYVGHPDQADYTMEVDILSDGNRRSMSSGGVINQRYLIMLKGNHQELEVSSNMELLKETVPFKWSPGVWYRLKTRVDVGSDGVGVIRAKAWQRDEQEPTAWTIEVTHPGAHRQGSPGVFGFTPQSRFSVYLDNLSVSTHE